MFEKLKRFCDSFLEMGVPGFDLVIYNYLKELKAIGYPNAKDLYDEYYKEHYKVIREKNKVAFFY